MKYKRLIIEYLSENKSDYFDLGHVGLDTIYINDLLKLFDLKYTKGTSPSVHYEKGVYIFKIYLRYTSLRNEYAILYRMNPNTLNAMILEDIAKLPKKD